MEGKPAARGSQSCRATPSAFLVIDDRSPQGERAGYYIGCRRSLQRLVRASTAIALT